MCFCSTVVLQLTENTNICHAYFTFHIAKTWFKYDSFLRLMGNTDTKSHKFATILYA